MLTFSGIHARTWIAPGTSKEGYYTRKLETIDPHRDPNQYARNIQKRDDAAAKAQAKQEEKEQKLEAIRTETQRLQQEIAMLETAKRRQENAIRPLQQTYERTKIERDKALRSEASALNALQTAILKGYDTRRFEERCTETQTERAELQTAFIEAQEALEPQKRQLDRLTSRLGENKVALSKMQMGLRAIINGYA